MISEQLSTRRSTFYTKSSLIFITNNFLRINYSINPTGDFKEQIRTPT